MKIYTLFDKVQQDYLPVFECTNDKDMVRKVVQLFNSHPNMNKDDFEIVYLCNFFYSRGTESNEPKHCNYTIKSLVYSVDDIYAISDSDYDKNNNFEVKFNSEEL